MRQFVSRVLTIKNIQVAFLNEILYLWIGFLSEYPQWHICDMKHQEWVLEQMPADNNLKNECLDTPACIHSPEKPYLFKNKIWSY